MRASAGWVLEILDASGQVERRVEVATTSFEIGRTARGLAFAEDTAMADQEARLVVSEQGVEILDSGTGSGVWLRVRGSEGRVLAAGDHVWLGAQILAVERVGAGWQLRHHGADGRWVGTHLVPRSGLLIGRGADLVLDPADRRLSRRHAELVVEGEALRLFDRGANNGTYLRITRAVDLAPGSEFRLATHHFRLGRRADPPDELREAPLPGSRAGAPHGLAARLRRIGAAQEPTRNGGAPSEEGAAIASESLAEKPLPRAVQAFEEATVLASRPIEQGDDLVEPQEALAAREEESGRGPEFLGSEGRILMVVDSDAGSVPIEAVAGQTILEAVQAAGLERGAPIDWECSDGRCGVCIVGVVEGADRLDPPDPATGEMKTIQITEQVVPDPSRYRLACRARIRGSVRLRKMT